MGCDIHAYVEYHSRPEPEEKENKWGDGIWWSFSRGQLHLGRNYYMFGLMADVRTDGICLFQPRGIPERVSWETRTGYTYYVKKDDSGEDYEHEGGMTSVHRSTAEKLVRDGSSSWYNAHEAKPGEPPKWVIGPGWHSASWLTTEEFARVIAEYEAQQPDWEQAYLDERAAVLAKEPHLAWAWPESKRYWVPATYRATLALMRELENGGRNEVRLVFFFDN